MKTAAMESPSEIALKCESGARALLQNALQEASQHLHKYRQLFSSYLNQDQSPQLSDSDQIQTIYIMTVIVTFSHLYSVLYMYFHVCGCTQYYYDIVYT